MHADRRTPAVLLAVLYTFSGGLCLVAAVWPMHRDTPVGLPSRLGVVGLGRRRALLVVRRPHALVGHPRGDRARQRARRSARLALGDAPSASSGSGRR